MRELEVKVLEIDHDATVATLESLGARRDFTGRLHAVYLDDPRGSLSGKEDCLRIRLEGDRAFLTYKGFLSDERAKLRDEIETTVGDFDAAREIMRRLGYGEWLEVRKYRWSYRLGAVHVTLDRFEGAHASIPELLEIEGPSLEEIHRVAQRLGHGPERLRAWTGAQVFEHYLSRSDPDT